MTINDVSIMFNLCQGEKIGYLLTNRQGKPLLHNDYLCKILSRTRQDFKKYTTFDYLPKSIEKQLSKFLSPGAKQSFKPLEIEFNPRDDDVNKRVKIAVNRLDVQEHDVALMMMFFEKQSSDADKETERFHRSLIDFQKFESEHAGKVMHDTIAQELYAIRISLQRFLLSFGYSEEIVPIKGMLNDVIGKVRDLANNLRPSVLHDLGFTSAIDDLIFNLGNHNITFKIIIDPRISTVSSEVHYSAYRIMQEMLAKCVSHREVKQVRVDIRVKDRTLVMSFDIDCEHFATEMEILLNRGAGMEILNNRVALYSGTIIISKASGKSSVEIKLRIK